MSTLNFKGTYAEAMEIIKSGINPEDDKPVTGAFLNSIKAHLTSRDGVLTKEVQRLKDRIPTLEPRSTERAKAVHELKMKQAEVSELTNAINLFKSERAANRIRGASKGTQTYIPGKGLIRALRILKLKKPEIYKEFLSDPAKKIREWERTFPKND